MRHKLNSSGRMSTLVAAAALLGVAGCSADTTLSVDEPAPTVASEKAQPIPMPSPTVDAKAKKLVKDLPVPPITFKKSINLTISNHSSWPVAASIAWLGFFKEEHNTKLLQPRQDMNASSVPLPNVPATMIWAAIATDHTKANADLSNVTFVNSYKGEPFVLGYLTVDGVRQPSWNHTWPQPGQRVYVYSGVGYTVERKADAGDHRDLRHYRFRRPTSRPAKVGRRTIGKRAVPRVAYVRVGFGVPEDRACG
ncbi:MAG: hypothetical protein WBO42_08085 [Candidatus Nanopelagicales bacterium]